MSHCDGDKRDQILRLYMVIQGNASVIASTLASVPPPAYLVYMVAAGFGLPVHPPLSHLPCPHVHIPHTPHVLGLVTLIAAAMICKQL